MLLQLLVLALLWTVMGAYSAWRLLPFTWRKHKAWAPVFVTAAVRLAFGPIGALNVRNRGSLRGKSWR